MTQNVTDRLHTTVYNHAVIQQDLAAISLFAGGGGLDLGIARAGFQTRVAVECERYACKTLRHNQSLRRDVGGDPYLDGCEILEGDIRSFCAEEILEAARLRVGEADLLVGGPPCVTFSVAGRRAGLQSDVGQLFGDYVRVLDEARPAAFIFENVKGLMTAPGGDGKRGGALETILEALAAPGYALTWRVVDAADYGVPQHRHRLIVLGVRGATPLRFPEPTHADPAKVGLFGEAGLVSSWRTVRDAIGDMPPAAPAGFQPDLPNHVARKYSPDVVASFAETPPGKRNPRYKRDRLRWDEPAKTIRAQGKPKADGSGQKNSSHQSIHPVEHRQLTVRESARLQTFPDWYEFDSTFVNGYRVVGDAVPPTLAESMATAVREQLFSTASGAVAQAA
jgi:DNA (cytosine-5)-methyltransferase 1